MCRKTFRGTFRRTRSIVGMPVVQTSDAENRYTALCKTLVREKHASMGLDRFMEWRFGSGESLFSDISAILLSSSGMRTRQKRYRKQAPLIHLRPRNSSGENKTNKREFRRQLCSVTANYNCTVTRPLMGSGTDFCRLIKPRRLPPTPAACALGCTRQRETL